MKRTKIPIVMCIILVVMLSVVGMYITRTEAFSAEEAVTYALDAMKLDDAQFVGKEPLTALSEDVYLLYTSEEAHMAFYFDPQDGSLAMAKNQNADFEADSSPYAELTAQEHTDYVMEYAQAAIAADLIGALEVEEAPAEDAYSKNYVFAEYYEGIPTGTRVTVSCLSNGEIHYIMPVFGELFQPASFGRYELRSGDEFIGEASAGEIAVKRVEEVGEGYLPTDTEPVIELRAMGGDLFYEVMLETANSLDWNRTYTIRVDAYDGEVLLTGYTK